DRAVATEDVPGGSLTWGWPTTLPTPRRDGSQVTYPDAMTAADLVLRALPAGFEASLVVRKRPTSPVTLRLPLTLPDGYTARESADGAVQILDGTGDPIRFVTPSLVHDAAV